MVAADKIREEMLKSMATTYQNELQIIMDKIQKAASLMQDNICIHNDEISHNKHIHRVLESYGYAINPNWNDGTPGWMIFWD